MTRAVEVAMALVVVVVSGTQQSLELLDIALAPGTYSSDCSLQGLHVYNISSVHLHAQKQESSSESSAPKGTGSRNSSVTDASHGPVFDCLNQTARFIFFDNVDNVYVSGITVQNAVASGSVNTSSSRSPLLRSGAAMLWQCGSGIIGNGKLNGNGSCTLVLQDCFFYNNAADGLVGGGAVGIYFPVPTINVHISITSCVFAGNSATMSSASKIITVVDRTSISDDAYFFEPTNSFTAFGGALSVVFDSAAVNVQIHIAGSQFWQNNVESSNINVSQSSPLIINNMVSSSAFGGAFSVFYASTTADSSINICNCSFIRNTAVNTGNFNNGINDAFGGAVSVYHSGNATNCLFLSSTNNYFSENEATNSDNIINNIYNNNEAQGGAINIFYANSSVDCETHVFGNNTFVNNSVVNTRFTSSKSPGTGSNNWGATGGSINVFHAVPSTGCQFNINDSVFTNNFAFNKFIQNTNNNNNNAFGGAVNLFFGNRQYNPDGLVTRFTFTVQSCLFSNNAASNHQSHYLNNNANKACGGAISVYFLSCGNDSNPLIDNNIQIIHTIFRNNSATNHDHGSPQKYYNSNEVYGGAVSVFVEICFSQMVNFNLTTYDTSFVDNAASNFGIFYYNDNNNAALGGAVSVYTYGFSQNCISSFVNSKFVNNAASNVNNMAANMNNNNLDVSYGGAISIYYIEGFSFGCITTIDSTFTNNTSVNQNNGNYDNNHNNNNAYGGAVCVYYYWEAEGCSVSVRNSSFNNNAALNMPFDALDFAYGGAVHVLFYMAFECSLTVINSEFEINSAGFNVNSLGGAINLVADILWRSCVVTIAESLFVANTVFGGAIRSGFGGAISMLFKDQVYDSYFWISEVKMDNNMAQNGGVGSGLSLFATTATNVSVYIDNCTCTNNSASGQAYTRGFGGAISIALMSSDWCVVAVTNSQFYQNYGNIGGALLIDIGNSMGGDSQTSISVGSTIIVDSCLFLNNSGNLGGSLAVVAANSNSGVQVTELEIRVSNTTFFNNTVKSGSGGGAYFSLVSGNLTIILSEREVICAVLCWC